LLKAAEEVLKDGCWKRIMPSKELTEGVSLAFEGFVLDAQRRGLYKGEERIHLTPIPYKVLEYLVQHRGIVISKEKLLDAVWGGSRDENVVEQAVRQIRRALGEEKDKARFIRTIPGMGYCFIAETRAVEGALPQKLDVTDQGKTVAGIAPITGRKPWATRKVIFLSAVAVCFLILILLSVVRPSPHLEAINPVRLTQSQALILSPLLGDGTNIYYPRYENGQFTVAATPVKGGERTLIATGLANPELCDMTTDGSAMLLRNLAHSRNVDEPLYVLFRGGKAQRVGNIMAYDAAWIPGSRSILYSTKGVIYSTNIAGNDIHRLFSVPGNAYWFRWSPDRSKLRFSVLNQKNEKLSLWEVDAGSDHPYPLFPKLGRYACCGTWTPNGKFYLFQVRDGGFYQIWAQPTRQDSLFPIDRRPYPIVFGAVSYHSPLVSKNGKELILRAVDARGELVRYDAKSGQFVPGIPSLSVRNLDFSKDGQWVAFTNPTDNNLWRCRSNATQCLPLTHDLRNTLMPRWSPDGKKIAFMGITYTGQWQIYVVSAFGGKARIAYHGTQAEGYPDWSPDGKLLAFSEVTPVAEPAGIHVLDLQTGNSSTLPGSTDFTYPRWSPDGRSLVAIHAGDNYLYIYNFAKRNWQMLANMRAGYPNWSRDGKEVYFESNTSGRRLVYRVGVADHTVQKVASLEGIDPSPSITGDWMGLGPDDAPLAVQNMNTDDIYEWNLVTK
jgi:Tol biopolymer transport system component/DNA-binding winged helix-turn-helix (wHTH) protein